MSEYISVGKGRPRCYSTCTRYHSCLEGYESLSELPGKIASSKTDAVNKCQSYYDENKSLIIPSISKYNVTGEK